MAFTDTSLAKYAMKKLLGVAHTGNAKDVGNEAEATRFFLGSKEVATYAISTTAGAVASTILDCTNATDGLATSRLRLTVDPSSSKSYFATVPTGHDLLNYTNPITGSAYIVGDRVSFIITKKWGISWRPILYLSGVEISPTASNDWFLEESGVLTSEDDLSLSTNGRLGCYVYVGPTVNTLVTGVSSVSNADGTLTISPTTGAVVASINLANDNSWSGRQTLTKSPTGLTNTTSCLVVNPGSATNESGLIWAGVSTVNKFLVDEDGDVTAQATISGTQLISTISTGTMPVSVTSTTNCTNLSADMCDGRHVGTSGTTIPLLSGNNTWGGLQTFGNNISIGGATFNITSLTTNDIIQYNGTNWVNVAGGGGGAVSSVSNADGSLTISPTTGAVVASLNVGHTNTWSVLQNFNEINIGTFAPSDTDNKFSNYLQSSSTSAQTFFYNTYSNTGASGNKISGSFSIESDSTLGSALLQGLYASAVKKGSSNTTETLEAIFGYAYTQSASTGNVSTLRGLRFLVELDGTGTVTLGECIKAQLANINTGTMSTGKNLYIPDAINSGGGSFTNIYGIHIEKQTKATNNYEIFLDTTGRIYFREATTSIHSNATGELTLTAATQVNVSNGLKIGSLNGLLKATSGVVGTASIDISADTNLAVSSPITLTGDTVGFDFGTANTWTERNTFTKTPSGLTSTTSSVVINPGSATNESGLLWAGIAGASKFTVDEDGDVTAAATITGTQLISTVSTGTPPLAVSSTTKVTSLNADLLDGLDSSAFATLAFKTIAVSGQSDVVADSATDTLTLVAGTNITITTDAATDQITINSSGGGGAVSSVSNSDGSLTISPTTGAVVASLNVGHANNWTGTQNFTLITGGEINLGSFVSSDSDNRFSNYLSSSSTSTQSLFYNYFQNTATSGDKTSAFVGIDTDCTSGSTNILAIGASAFKKGSSTTTEVIGAIQGYSYTSASSTGGVGTLRAGYLFSEMVGSGNVTLAEALKLEIININTGTMTTGRHIYIPAATNSGGGSITTLYGIHLGKQTAGGSNYEMFLDSDGRVYFRSSGVNIYSNATDELTINAPTRVNISNGLKIGTLSGILQASSGVVTTSNRLVLSYLGL